MVNRKAINAGALTSSHNRRQTKHFKNKSAIDFQASQVEIAPMKDSEAFTIFGSSSSMNENYPLVSRPQALHNGIIYEKPTK